MSFSTCKGRTTQVSLEDAGLHLCGGIPSLVEKLCAGTLVGSVPAHGKAGRTGWSLRSLP